MALQTKIEFALRLIDLLNDAADAPGISYEESRGLLRAVEIVQREAALIPKDDPRA